MSQNNDFNLLFFSFLVEQYHHDSDEKQWDEKFYYGYFVTITSTLLKKRYYKANANKKRIFDKEKPYLLFVNNLFYQ